MPLCSQESSCRHGGTGAWARTWPSQRKSELWGSTSRCPCPTRPCTSSPASLQPSDPARCGVGGSANPCPGASSGLGSRTGTDGSWHCNKAPGVLCPMGVPVCAVSPCALHPRGCGAHVGPMHQPPVPLHPIPGGCAGCAGATQGRAAGGGRGPGMGSWTRPGWWRAGGEDAPCQSLPNNSWGGGGTAAPDPYCCSHGC